MTDSMTFPALPDCKSLHIVYIKKAHFCIFVQVYLFCQFDLKPIFFPSGITPFAHKLKIISLLFTNWKWSVNLVLRSTELIISTSIQSSAALIRREWVHRLHTILKHSTEAPWQRESPGAFPNLQSLSSNLWGGDHLNTDAFISPVRTQRGAVIPKPAHKDVPPWIIITLTSLISPSLQNMIKKWPGHTASTPGKWLHPSALCQSN